MKQYQVVRDVEIFFVAKVNALLRQGWVCQGGVYTYPESGWNSKTWYCQAMVLEVAE